jgi:predicted Zn-dependent protease
MLQKLKCFLVEAGHISDKCRNIRIANGTTDMWKNMDLAGGDQMGSNTYVISENKSSVLPDTQPQPWSLYPHQPKQYLLEILKVGFNFKAE